MAPSIKMLIFSCKPLEIFRIYSLCFLFYLTLFIITSKAAVFSILLLFLSHVSLDDTRAVMNPKLFFYLDPNPNEVACRISDPNPTIYENVMNWRLSCLVPPSGNRILAIQDGRL